MTLSKYDLFIRIENGIAVHYPMTRENIEQAFPEVDLNNPASSPIRFEPARITPQPTERAEEEFKVWWESEYQNTGSYWTQSWAKRDMTQKERLEQEISNAVVDKKERQLNKYLESVGLSAENSAEEKRVALDLTTPEYVFNLSVD